MNESRYTGQRGYYIEGRKRNTSPKFYRHNDRGYLKSASFYKTANYYGEDCNGKDWCYYSIWSRHRRGRSNRIDHDYRI